MQAPRAICLSKGCIRQADVSSATSTLTISRKVTDPKKHQRIAYENRQMEFIRLPMKKKVDSCFSPVSGTAYRKHGDLRHEAFHLFSSASVLHQQG